MDGEVGMPGRLIYVMGPSGVGKDSLIDAARGPLRDFGCEVVRRVITRSAESVGEDAQGVSSAEFEQLAEQGAFALFWRANGLGYGIPVQIDQWLADGRHVLINGSRGYLEQARLHYPDLIPILLTVTPEVLRQRLTRRGRENAGEIEARLKRNELFQADAIQMTHGQILQLDNSGELSVTVSNLLEWLKHEGVNAKSGQI